MAEKKRFKIEKRPLYREEIKATLMEAIASGELQPGDRIVETRWAKELGVSQSPIREAIRELEMVGLVENIPYKGCIVRKITTKDIVDTYRVRAALESMAICEAIHSEDKTFLEQMQEAMEGMLKSVAERNVKQFVEEDVRFHEAFVEHSENGVLKRLWEQCSIRDNTRISTLFSTEALTSLAERHQSIIDVIQAGDEERGKIEIARHFQLLIEGLRDMK